MSHRFTQDAGNNYLKINHHTAFETDMDLKNFVFEGVQTDTTYELAGVICHLNAGFNNGHYIAFCKRNNRYTSLKYFQSSMVCDKIVFVVCKYAYL